MARSRREYGTGTRSSGPELPLGIKIICVLTAIAVVVQVPPVLVLLGQFWLGGVVGVVWLCFACYLIVGLWNLRPWAWSAAVAVFAIQFLYFLVTWDLPGVALNWVLLGYVATLRGHFRA